MDIDRARGWIEQVWDDSITPTLVEYVRIPNKSPSFDPDWAEHGYMDDAVNLAYDWVKQHAPSDASHRIVRIDNRTPVLVVDIPGTQPGNILLYGHLDKQPEMTGWEDGLGPWIPVIRDGKLYGRGGADDGYAVFASLTALNALREQGIPHPRCFVLIECCEESGSYDLPAYVDHLAAEIGEPELVICLDSGAGNYDQLWLTTSLRGLVGGALDVRVLEEGVHSGDASGIVPSSFRIARQLVDRVEDLESGEIKLAEFHCDIPQQRIAQARKAAAILGDVVSGRFPWVPGMSAVSADLAENVLARTWKPALSTTGVGGIPPMDNAGNVLRPGTQLQLSLRTPPLVDAPKAYDALKACLEASPPYGASVSFDGHAASGWHAPLLKPWLHEALDQASQGWYQQPAMYMGEGGTIPFMGMLGDKFPNAQFVITGVLGPGSNAHGPNEFLHLAMAKNLTGCVAQILKICGDRNQARHT